MQTFYIILGVVGAIVIVGGLTLLYMIAPHRYPAHKVFPSHFAHRGLHNNKDCPENSMTAFAKALEKGYGIELDIRLTKDNQLVVFHDDTLARMAKNPMAVHELTLEQLKQIHLLDTLETIPTFSEVLDLVKGRVPLLIEYKTHLPGSNVTLICDTANEILKDYLGFYVIESFDYSILKWYRIHRPDIIRGQLAMGTKCYLPALGKEKASLIPQHRQQMMSYLLYNFVSRPHFIGYRYQDISFIVNLNRYLGAKVACWTVRFPSDGEKLLREYDSIIFENYLA